MRAVVQRVTTASVSVDGEVISSIGKGLCVLLGISKNDTPKEIDYMVKKILNLRVFDDDGSRWKKSVVDKNFEILCVSQFTLQAVLKGTKPDFHLAMGGDQSESFYQDFLQNLRSAYKEDAIKDGKFGAYMQVHIQNDGPVTISLETPHSKPVQDKQVKQGQGSSKATGRKQDEKGVCTASLVDQEKNDPEQNLVDVKGLSLDEK
ncbi:D-aminoacyl-tRNA deacylase-like isoform X1 [Acropora palmata]|uniref:D-aminoacyl-tRNA deacylase-like isoform X1 n=1 Tax=Acropora palmata TaxID=6131 RepID=UPI003DA135A5